MIFEIVAEGAEWTVLQADADFVLPQVIDNVYMLENIMNRLIEVKIYSNKISFQPKQYSYLRTPMRNHYTKYRIIQPCIYPIKFDSGG